MKWYAFSRLAPYINWLSYALQWKPLLAETHPHHSVWSTPSVIIFSLILLLLLFRMIKETHNARDSLLSHKSSQSRLIKLKYLPRYKNNWFFQLWKTKSLYLRIRDWFLLVYRVLRVNESDSGLFLEMLSYTLWNKFHQSHTRELGLKIVNRTAIMSIIVKGFYTLKPFP